ncbi:MULE domain-containing protein [Aphis craccivora]|uniref:MULE domain-containing protein n=1 Tax=Aphis craccivora TaxID=307492 RepID=A0A6G0Y082_APHCR|nr:MULE domain-containing protein [Aphis craccivora]
MVYAFLISMNQENYEVHLNVVRNLLPLNYAELCIITDFETPLMNSVLTIMTESKLMGCWSHYCQAVIRHSKRKMDSVFHLFQNNPIAARVFRMVVLALSHLPAHRVHPDCPRHDVNDGFRTIINYVQQFPDIEEQLRTFHHWIYR